MFSNKIEILVKLNIVCISLIIFYMNWNVYEIVGVWFFCSYFFESFNGVGFS